MTDDRAGRLIAAVRKHLGLRQIDLARAANVDQKVVSLLERGELARVSVDRFRRICAALKIEPVLELRWRGGLADRLIDRGHARIVEAVVAELVRLGWECIPEYTFNVFGDRGSVDVLAWHPVRRALLLVEVKTWLTNLQAMLSSLSRKVRLVPGVVAEERGWDRLALGHVVVVPGYPTQAVDRRQSSRDVRCDVPGSDRRRSSLAAGAGNEPGWAVVPCAQAGVAYESCAPGPRSGSSRSGAQQTSVRVGEGRLTARNSGPAGDL